MKIIYNNLIPFKGYKCINLFGVLFARKNAQITGKDLNHEKIHTAQMKELLYIFYYFLYIFEFIVYLSRECEWNKAYHKISFEQEAFDNEENQDYLTNRKHYAWFKYW